MTDKWIIYRQTRGKNALSFYVGKTGFVKSYSRFSKIAAVGQSGAKWSVEIDNKIVVFPTYLDAKKEIGKILKSWRDYTYGIDLHPESRYA